jgi:hypothetical protein
MPHDPPCRHRTAGGFCSCGPHRAPHERPGRSENYSALPVLGALKSFPVPLAILRRAAYRGIPRMALAGASSALEKREGFGGRGHNLCGAGDRMCSIADPPRLPGAQINVVAMRNAGTGRHLGDGTHGGRDEPKGGRRGFVRCSTNQQRGDRNATSRSPRQRLCARNTSTD